VTKIDSAIRLIQRGRVKPVNRLSTVLSGRPAFGRLRDGIWLLGSLLILIGVWSGVAAVVSGMRGVEFPTPWQTVVRLAVLLAGKPFLGHPLYVHTAHSLVRWAMGFGIAAACGIAMGLSVGWWRSLERLFMPLVHGLQLIPGLAWIPVALLLFGVGRNATVFMIAMTAFAPIVINVHTGVNRLDQTLIRAARMLGTRGQTLFLRVLLPGALPYILSGLRIGFGNGWRVLVAGEMVVGTGTGLGYAIIQARWTLDYQSAFACILVICLIGFAFEHLVFASIERATVKRWSLGRQE